MFAGNLDILWVLVVLVVSGAFVAWGSEPLKTKLSQIGGVAFILWLLIQIIKYLVAHG